MRLRPFVTEVARKLAEYINRFVFRGERSGRRRGKKAVAELRTVPAGKRLGELPALLAGLPCLGEADARGFAADLETARSELSRIPLPDPRRS